MIFDKMVIIGLLMKLINILLSILLYISFLSINLYAISSDKITIDNLRNMSLVELMNIEITSSTKTKVGINQAPSIMYAITDKQIQERAYKTLADVLGHVPGWDFDSPNGNWVGQYAFVRGTRAVRHILLLVDGVVQNNINDFESGRFHTFNLNSVKRVEVINGPASALYGANALLGVINITSKSSEDINGIEISASTTTATSTNEWFKQDYNILYGKTFSNDIGLMLSLDLINSDDDGEHYYDPDGIYTKGTVLVRNNDASTSRVVADDGFNNHQKDYHLKLRLNKGDDIKLGFDYSDMDEGLGTFLDASNYLTNSSLSDYKWHVTRLSSFISGMYKINDEIKIEPKIYYREDEIKDDSGFAYTYDQTGGYPAGPEPKPSGTMRHFKQKTSRFGFDLATRYEPNEKLSVLFGYNFESDNTQSEYSDWFLEDPDNNYDRTMHSLYLQTSYDMTNNLNFLLAARYNNENDVDAEFIPRASIVYDLNMPSGGELITKLMYGESFRALATYEKQPNADNPNSPGVVPEKAQTYEFQVIYLPNKKQKYDISMWYTDIQDLRIEGTNAYNLINGEEKNYREQKTWGLQASVDIVLSEKLNWMFNYTYTDGENEDLYYQNTDRSVVDEVKFNELIHVSKHKFNTSLNYKYNQSFNYNILVKYVGKKEASPFDSKFRDEYTWDLDGDGSIDYNGDGFNKSYILTDLTINYKPKGIDGLLTYVKVNNLFDEEYVDMTRSEGWWTPYYHPQPGRTINLGLKYKF